MAEEKNKGGRPRLTEAQKAQRKEDLSQKLEPYLKSGLSVNKALSEAKVFNSEFYKYMSEDELFGEKIAKYRQYVSVLVNHVLFAELLTIVEKQNGNKAKNIEAQQLSKEDKDFLWWYAFNSNSCREEWGRRVKVSQFDAEAEMQKIKQLINDSMPKDLHPLTAI